MITRNVRICTAKTLSSHYLSVIEFLKCYFLKTNEKNKNNYNSKKKVLNSFLFPTDKNIETS